MIGPAGGACKVSAVRPVVLAHGWLLLLFYGRDRSSGYVSEHVLWQMISIGTDLVTLTNQLVCITTKTGQWVRFL